jgi:hypothetical protein
LAEEHQRGDVMVTVVPRDDDRVGHQPIHDRRDTAERPGSAGTAPTLLGTVRATIDLVMHNPEMALVVAIVIAVAGGIVGWW